MPGNLNKIWDAVSGNIGTSWKISRSTGGWSGVRGLFREAGLMGKRSGEARYAVGMASRFLSGAVTGAVAGGAWGAVSDKESIIGGAMKGAFVGGAAALSLRHFRPNIRNSNLLGGKLRYVNNLSRVKLTNIKEMRQNLRRSWDFMSTKKNQGLRNWVIGMGLFGTARGMMSKDDNPIGGAVSGTVGGGIQGAAIYGGYRLAKSKGLLKNLKFKGMI